jgi:hypothetical protein
MPGDREIVGKSASGLIVSQRGQRFFPSAIRASTAAWRTAADVACILRSCSAVAPGRMT